MNSLDEKFLQKVKKISNCNINLSSDGPQGRGQSLNLKDNKINVSLGLRKGSSWDKPLEDGWVEGKDLFEMEEACSLAK
jgi:ketol-acid reductoisomerase